MVVSFAALATGCASVRDNSGAHARAGKTIDVIVVAGQSNAVGFGTRADELPAAHTDSRVMFWYRCGDPPADEFDSTSGNRWTYLQAQPRGTPNPDKRVPRQYGNFAHPQGGFGPEVGLARAWNAAHPGTRLAVIKAAFNGTRLAFDWQPGSNGERGESYRAMVNDTKLALAAARSNKLEPRLRALAWVQGEGDANATDAPEYERRLVSLIAALRRDLDAPDLPVLLTVNPHHDTGGDPHILQIINAQKSVAEAVPNCAYVDMTSASVADRSHFDSEGMLETGRRLALALEELQAAAPPVR